MKFSFTICYTDDMLHHMDAMDAKLLVAQACVSSQTVEVDTLEDAVYSIRDTLALDHKTLKSLTLLNIEV
ncbi:hypothetical protein MUP77_00295 [Candidatus Bathyarchaeota archaeon]|nr:hypothetical protein [Candidatus Bathyarchaeota archaeon]